VPFVFGGHVLDVDRRELRRGGELVALEPQVFDLLVYLIRNRERVASKDELIANVWSGRTVTESSLTTRVNGARKAVGDNGATQQVIRTIPRKGIRFVAPVREEMPAAPAILTLPDKPSIAVLAFTNMSDDPRHEHFADGMVEDLITNLSRMHWLFVIARSSSFMYKSRAVDLRRVGEDLGVRYVVEGSVRRVADRLRVTVQLIETETGRHIWADRYDRHTEDIFAVQDEITDTISAVLEPEISNAERERARRKAPEHLGAWELYQRAMWHLLRRNRANLADARVLLREAVAIDPNFATAHAAIALSCNWLIAHGIAENADETRAEQLRQATVAVNLDARDPLAHCAMGLALTEIGEHDKAVAALSTATSLNPNSSFGQWCFGYALNRADRYAEALDRFDLALRLSPRDPAAWSFLALRAAALYQLGDYAAAAASAREATRAQVVDLVWPHVHLAASLGRLDRQDKAARAIAELRRLRPGLTISQFRAWPLNRHRSIQACERIVGGLRAAGLPE
jgi:TolB-like protein/Tfp pilus assembly protein PilF